MRSNLPELAADLGADERTLRRAVRRGAVRCRRPGARQLEFLPGELGYLRSHWTLLLALAGALRTEPNVRLAVVHGSAARGDDRPDSDLDLLVALRDTAPGAAAALTTRLERSLGRHVDVAELSRVEADVPLLLLEALEHGRVIVDRDGLWPPLLARRDAVEQAARRAEVAERRALEASWRMLVEDA